MYSKQKFGIIKVLIININIMRKEKDTMSESGGCSINSDCGSDEYCHDISKTCVKYGS